jgi:hypothetical protein
MYKAKIKMLKIDAQSAAEGRESEDVARTLRLDKRLAFLVRLLDTRFTRRLRERNTGRAAAHT